MFSTIRILPHWARSETKYYSCGVTYRDWTSGDNPMCVHKRISSSCSLVINNGSNRYFENNSVLYETPIVALFQIMETVNNA